MLNGKYSIFLTLMIVFGGTSASAGADKVIEHPEWSKAFKASKVTGTIVIKRMNEPTRHVFNPKRAEEGKLPASTFKIANSLIAFDTGVVNSPEMIFRWDGKSRAMASWNKDLTFTEAFAASAVPVFQTIARDIGRKRMEAAIDKIDYGNENISGGIDTFWLSGALRISAHQQIDFIERLYAKTLPLSSESQTFIRKVMPSVETDCFRIQAKTGWGIRVEPHVGWWVGWAEAQNDTLLFALNIDVVDRTDLSARKSVVIDVLKQQNILPERNC